MPVISLGWIAIVMGGLIALSRVPLLVNPEKSRAVIRRAFAVKVGPRLLGLFVLLAGLAAIKAVVQTDHPLEIIMLIFGVLWLFAGIVLAVRPAIIGGAIENVCAKSDPVFRAINLFILAAGVVLIYLGAAVYGLS